MFTTEPLTRDLRPDEVEALNTARAQGKLGGRGDSKAITFAAAVVVLIVAVLIWLGGWVLPFQSRLPRAVASVVAFVVPLLALMVPVGVLWQAIPELFRRRSARMSWQRVAAFARANHLEYRVDESEIPPSQLMRSEYVSEETVVRSAAGPFGETGKHTWSFDKPSGDDDFATSHYIWFRLPRSMPYALIYRSGAKRSYDKPLRHTMDGYPAAKLGLAIQERYAGVALAGYDPLTWDVLTNQLLTTIERLGGDCDVEICEQGLWLHSDQEFDLRDPRFWRVIDVVIANVLAQVPGAGLNLTPLPIPVPDEPGNKAFASLAPDPAAPDDSGISCGGIVAVSLVLQLVGLALHVFAHWPVR